MNKGMNTGENTGKNTGNIKSLIHQAASLLLAYPGPDWPRRLETVRAALHAQPGEQAALLRQFVTHVRDMDALALAARYVDTFDRSPRRTLHLTYYTDGDTRRRGGTLAALKSRYRTAGWEPGEDELPDHLPVMLEFAARSPEPGRRLLTEYRAALEMLGFALDEYGSPYARILEAVCRTLPGPRPADRSAARRLARTGPPPLETVGLDVFPTPRTQTQGARR